MIAYYDSSGRYIWVGHATKPVPGAGDPPPHPMESVARGKYVGSVNQDKQYHDIENDRPVDMPPRPSEAHDFDYAAKQWVPNVDRAWMLVRIERDRRLKATDWMVTRATEHGTQLPTPIAAYRQALRDITNQTDPTAIAWPQFPA